MKNDKLHQSKELTKHFAPYRDEEPLLSAPQVNKLLAERDMLPNRSTKSINVRRIIMTLIGITGLAAVGYFAFFSSFNGSNVPDASHGAYPSLGTVQEQKTLSKPESTPQPNLAVRHASQKNDTHGPWSAGNDQYYADLTSVELHKLGIILNDDTIVNYRLSHKDDIEIGKVAAHYIQGMGRTESLPAGIDAHHFFPELITFANGNGAAWRTDSSCGMIASEINTLLLPWLKKPGTPGIHALGFSNHHAYGGVGYDTLRLEIGKNFAQPAPFPFAWYEIDPHWDSVKDEVMELAHYYEGSAAKPTVELPKNFTLAVDTITPQDLLDQFAQEQNSSDMQHLRSIMSRLNELVPVIVRMTPGKGAPGDKDFILWYEPSEELFNALPPAQAAIFRGSKAPHCMNAPEAVTSSAEVTYCVSEPQEVKVDVFDLSGHDVMSLTQMAESGDNIAQISTRSLPSGIYIVSVRDKDGSQRTRRIWVQNANPTR